MKLILLVSMFMASFAFANSSSNMTSEELNSRPWPQMSYTSYGVRISMNNYDNRDYHCSGSVYILLASGKRMNQYYSKTIFARTNEYKIFRNYNYNDRIISASHTISCY